MPKNDCRQEEESPPLPALGNFFEHLPTMKNDLRPNLDSLETRQMSSRKIRHVYYRLSLTYDSHYVLSSLVFLVKHHSIAE